MHTCDEIDLHGVVDCPEYKPLVTSLIEISINHGLALASYPQFPILFHAKNVRMTMEPASR